MLALCTAALSSDPTAPVFSEQYSARIDEVEEQPLGHKKMSCDFFNDAVGNTTSYRNCGWKGTQMQMVIRFSDTSGPDAKIFYIYGHGPFGDKCAYWCDGQADEQCNIQESLCQSDYVKSARYTGAASLNGTNCDVFKWEDKLSIISMNSLTLYTKHASAIPVRMFRDIHPFYKELGNITTTFSNYQEGTPPASAFAVPGEDKCMQGDAPQCPNGATVREHIARFKRMQLDS